MTLKHVQVDLRADGLLWLINRTVFHPRGYALGYDEEDGSFWLLGNGTEPWEFTQDDTALLMRIKELMP
jgi:hypothetical protein